jgi:hypothetical protein
MPAKTIPFSIRLSGMVLITLCLCGCGSQATKRPTLAGSPTEVPLSTATHTDTPEPANTIITPIISTPTLTPTPYPSSTPKPTTTNIPFTANTSTPTIIGQAPFAGLINQNGTFLAITQIVPSPTRNPTSQAWHATAQAIAETEGAVSQQVRDNKATQIAQFPSIICEGKNVNYGDISPNGKWWAAGCGYESNQTLTVQNKGGTKWVLEFKDFLNPDTPMGMTGLLLPLFWSPEGEYLYFTPELGYSGGGTECFNRMGNYGYGLFRLNLKTGSWATLVQPTYYFPGFIIEFSPTGRRYAVESYGGIMINDLQNGEVTQIDAPHEYNFIWSPDGKRLAYSVASCGEFYVQSSSVYVWDASTGQLQILFTTEGILLSPESWIDNSKLRILGEKIVDGRDDYTIYEYSLNQESLTFTGTATPYP